MQIKTSRFGTIEVSEESIITLVRGMYGFEQYTRFCMINYKPGDSIWWIQSVDEPELAFVVADPAQLYNDYEFDIADADAEKLHLCEIFLNGFAQMKFVLKILHLLLSSPKFPKDCQRLCRFKK